MSRKIDIERALKDNDYLMSLTPEEIKSVPWNPAGGVEATEKELDKIVGGLYAVSPSGCTTSAGSCLACKRTTVAPGAC